MLWFRAPLTCTTGVAALAITVAVLGILGNLAALVLAITSVIKKDDDDMSWAIIVVSILSPGAFVGLILFAAHLIIESTG